VNFSNPSNAIGICSSDGSLIIVTLVISVVILVGNMFDLEAAINSSREIVLCQMIIHNSVMPSAKV
jgi:hypothetical protein